MSNDQAYATATRLGRGVVTVVPVTTLQGALDALSAWRAGESLPTCPAM